MFPKSVVVLSLAVCLHWASGLLCPLDRVSFVRTVNVSVTVKSRGVNVSLTRLPNGTFRYLCHERCLSNPNCTGYFIDHYNKFCHGVLTENGNEPEQELRPRMVTFFKKICLSDTAPCHYHWIAENEKGVSRRRYTDRVIRDVNSKIECLEACFRESSFICRSAQFDDVNRTCNLSRHDRHTVPGAPATSRGSVNYLENRCVQEPKNCSFVRISGDTLQPLVVIVPTNKTLTIQDCRLLCRQEKTFWCRTMYFNPRKNVCALSPDAPSSDERNNLQRMFPDIEDFSGNDDGHWFLRTDCIDVSMKCDLLAMTAIVTVSPPFDGRMYSLSDPSGCFIESQPHSNELILELPLQGIPCGTVASTNQSVFRFYQGNGTFSNSIVIQRHPTILRSSDKRVDVACDYQKHQMRLRSGKQIVDQDIRNVTVVKGVVPAPDVRLHIVNTTGYDVKNVAIGTNLFLQVTLEDERVYGIFGSRLVATSGDGTETIRLLDESGCSIDPKVFPPLELIPGSKTLQAHFQAFRFTADTTVRFQMVLDFCLDTCPPVKCSDGSEEPVLSYGRKKRYATHTIPTEIVSAIKMESQLVVTGEKTYLDVVSGNQKQIRTTRTVCTSSVIVGLISALLALAQCIIIVVCACAIWGKISWMQPEHEELTS